MISQLKITYALVIALMMAPLATLSQETRELLQPVEKEAVQRLMSPSQYGLRAQLYFAKRYRIVNVNFDVLDKGDSEFTVTPFDDLKMVLVATPEKYASAYDQLREWKGELKYPVLQVLEPGQTGFSGKTRRIQVDLWVRTGEHEIPLKLVREIAEANGDTTTLSGLPDAATQHGTSGLSAGFGKMYLRTLSGQWFVPALKTSIVIRPIDGDPRFHIVYEEDRDKVAAGGDVPDEETTRKLEAAKKFMKALEQERAAAMSEQKQN